MSAADRLERQRTTLRPIGALLSAVVIAAAIEADPAPALHGRGLGVLLSLAVFGGGMLWLLGWTSSMPPLGVGLIGAGAIALGLLQPDGQSEIASSIAVYIACARLPLRPAIAWAGVVVLGTIVGLAGHSSAAEIISAALLCVLMGAVALFVDAAREGQARAERLVVELREARAAETRAAAAAERGRIAAELHDVLAHALSGLAVQLEGARMLATREDASPALREAIDRSRTLAREGLEEAKRAVGALRGDDLPGPERLPALVADLRRDLGVDATLQIDGEPRPLSADAGLALYRGAQEALTNVARHAPGARADVRLRFEAARTVLTVIDTGATEDASPVGEGGGFGLSGMRERVARAGGALRVGPAGDGFQVELELPQ